MYIRTHDTRVCCHLFTAPSPGASPRIDPLPLRPGPLAQLQNLSWGSHCHSSLLHQNHVQNPYSRKAKIAAAQIVRSRREREKKKPCTSKYVRTYVRADWCPCSHREYGVLIFLFLVFSPFNFCFVFFVLPFMWSSSSSLARSPRHIYGWYFTWTLDPRRFSGHKKQTRNTISRTVVRHTAITAMRHRHAPQDETR